MQNSERRWVYLSFPESHLKEILTFLLSRFNHKVHSQSQKKTFLWLPIVLIKNSITNVQILGLSITGVQRAWHRAWKPLKEGSVKRTATKVLWQIQKRLLIYYLIAILLLERSKKFKFPQILTVKILDERSRKIDACKNKCNKPNNKCNEIDEKCECLTGYAEDKNGNCKCILGMIE